MRTATRERAMPSARVVLLMALYLLCASCARQQPPFTLKQVAPNVWAAIDNPKAQPSSYANAGVAIGDNGVAVIDTFASIDAAKQLLIEIHRLTPLPIKFVINTHYHSDHVAGNGVFAAAGALVLAHRNVRDWIHTENLRLMTEGMASKHLVITPEQRSFIEGFVAPTAVYENGVDLYLGSRRLEVRSFPGHTGGDSVVIVPDVKVMFAGDLFWRNTAPNTIDASTKPWIDTLNTLAQNQGDYVFVPGHGDVGKTADVLAFRDYLATLRQLVGEAQRGGKAGAPVVDAVLPQMTARYEKWAYIKDEARASITEMDAELRGTKRTPKTSASQP